jgi:OOP family OmpA-OmpF porin
VRSIAGSKQKEAMRKIAIGPSFVSGLFALACATPVVKPVDVQPVTPASGQSVSVDHSILLVDSSGSISRMEQFPNEKALVQSLVSAMPAGKYEAGAIQFGGVKRENHALAPFDRAALGTYAGDLDYLSEGTPLDQAFEEAGEQLKGKKDHAAITVISDGIPTDVVGREVPEDEVLDAAKEAAKGYEGKVCVHTVQVGSDAAGTAFLQKLAKTTDCGSYRSASSLGTASSLQAFQRDVYFGAAPVVAAVDGDDDEDGVKNSKDRCPNTPKLVRVDERGCWASRDVYFETNSAEIDEDSKELLRTLGVAVLKANPDLRVRVDGHTDARGSDKYNQALSERRAAAVRKFFIDEGIDGGRLESRGFGESAPAAPNDTAENMRMNRRVEFTPI